MTIHLQNLLPHPLSDIQQLDTDVWQKDLKIESSSSNLFYAPSGKGKTTLLSMLYGMRKDYSGTILIDQSDIRDFALKQWAELRCTKLSFVFQGLRLFKELSAFENIELKNSISGFKSEKEIMALAERLDIAPFMQQKAGTMSFGQQQRVAILRALCQPFEFILLDEPFSHLDEVSAAKAFDVIAEECRAQGAGFCMTSLSDDTNWNFNGKFRL
jgi:ABC-type lipoprotein export system ATPase subunit